MAEESAIRAIGGVPGFMSPIGLSKDAIVVVDAAVMEMHNAVCGANEEDCHYKNANPKRDFGDVIVADIRLIEEGDPCPHCGAPVKMTHGIEVGQVFKLGIKYSKALGATFLDENGKEKPLIMGCYGIGVSRTMAAAIEQFQMIMVLFGLHLLHHLKWLLYLSTLKMKLKCRLQKNFMLI